MPELTLTISTLAWIIALTQAIISLYVLYLNPRDSAYRYVGLSLFLVALNTFALGALIGAKDADAARWSTIALAATSPLLTVALLQASVALLKPGWLSRTAARRGLLLARLIGSLPLILTIVDVYFGRRIWYTPLNAAVYRGGYVAAWAYTGGGLSLIVNALCYGLVGGGLLIFLLYIAALSRAESRSTRWMAGLMLLANLLAVFSNLLSLRPWIGLAFSLAASIGYLTVYTLAAFRQSRAEQRPSGSLQQRITVLALLIALPLLAAMGLLLTNQARLELEKNAAQSLAAISQNVTDAGEVWLTYSNRALRTLVTNNDIISMDPELQTPILRALVSTYPDMYLASTTDLQGKNIARSDGRPLLNYSDRKWFQEIVNGLPVSMQISLLRASGEPTLTVAMPIRSRAGQIIGVGMYAAELTQINRLVTQQQALSGATIFIINERNQLLATSSPLDVVMGDMSKYPPVQALRQGTVGAYRFTDITGARWIAHTNLFSNNWGVIVQERESELFAPIRNFQRLSLAVLAIGALILLSLTWSTIRQALQPVRSLTETVAAITAGDLSREAPVYGQDELSSLARSFNTMTAQLRELIGNLEARVSERTQDLERRALQLQVTAEVAREAAAIHDPAQLLQDVTRLISERFGFYHVGVFLVEQMGQGSDQPTYAVLRAANSKGGQRMLARGHRLKVGKEGIVGYAAASGTPRIALDVGKDAVYFNNPDLPMTRSELALPLKIKDRVIGVLDVQSHSPSAFTPGDLETLQILADQLAIAIENARLLAESQQSLRELESLYGRQIQQGWQKRLRNQPLIYTLDSQGIRVSIGDETTKENLSTQSENGQVTEIEAPIELRGVRLGVLRLRRRAEEGPWSQHEIEATRETVAQMAQALENARLLEEIQNRAKQEELINQIVGRAQSALSLDAVMRTTVQEITRAISAARVQIRLGSANSDADSGGNGNSQNSATRGGEGGEA
ncbi:MAG: GAF domain-containing protein [Anaerolineales bacterium]|nr:GAF domain-containing protein [Anaerolineales bacterium]